MDQISVYFLTFMENGGFLAPLMFIGFHLLRPLFFLPVVFICITGGILFGAVAGTVYSVIGISLSSLVFYRISRWMPGTLSRLVRMKQRLMGKGSNFTTSQVAILRLVPFIHFHLLSLCILEVSANFKDYMRSSIYSNIPIAVVYTSFGKWISSFSPVLMALSLFLLIPLIYLLRRKEIKVEWEEFFLRQQTAGTEGTLKNK
ncbi:TVP38/TMEM64 family protein [Sediminibacillus massiliensis]|uniref:TVP38/TMEM64 family protein n=1 Tax=Sediminibacillus massiliensis TaxID=1926277 RepID=UPI00098873BB|nr:VTT domain-containing protein [Sediminibacillus massiliensis]